MKLLFVVSGIGLGDATREHANIKEIKKKLPKSKVMVAGYDNSYAYFRDKYNTIKIRGYKLPGASMKINVLHFGLRNIFLPAFWFIGTLKVRLQAFNFIPDIIISDFEPVGISLSKVLNRKCLVVFGYDPELCKTYKKKYGTNYKLKIESTYFEQLYDQADHVLIPTFRKKKGKHLQYSYINPIIRVQPKELPSVSSLMKKLGLKKKPILVMLGGSNFGTKLAKHINKIAKESKEEFYIFGGNLEGDFNKNVHYIQYTDNFFKYLKVCKGVITLAGQQTLAEALVYKKPILSYPIGDHIEQIINAYSIENTIMVSHKHSFKEVNKTVKLFLKNLSKIKAKVKKLNVQGNGAEQVADIVKLLKDRY
tara:strand:- start:233 stop:1327 length:1095 start_codon:yes stop_codon:yes gene_type:complete